MKTLTKKEVVILMAMLFGMLPVARGQYNFIDVATSRFSDNSIVREVDVNRWMVYNEEMNHVYLSRVTHLTSQYMQTVDLGNRTFRINDMEVTGNRIYFCGYTNNAVPTKAMAGYFEISAFPSVTMVYETLDSMLAFEKMELISVPTGGGGTRQCMVMIGKDLVGNSRFVFAYPQVVDWNFEMFNIPEGTAEILDDVVVTDSLVVFTGRSVSYSRGYMFYLPYPSPTYLPTQPVQCREFLYAPYSPILTEYYHDDYFVTLTSGYADNLLLSCFDGLNYISTLNVVLNMGYISIQDLKYKLSGRDLDILLQFVGKEEYGSLMLHVHDSFFGEKDGVIDAHKSLWNWLVSLTNNYNYYPPEMFTATGSDPSFNLTLHDYRYLNVGQCWEKESFHFNNYTNDGRLKVGEMYKTKAKVEQRVSVYEASGDPIKKVCGVREEEDNQ